MNFNEFHNGLRILLNIDRDEVARALSPLYENAADWDESVTRFMANPHMWFIRAPDAEADAIWELVEGRMNRRAA